MLIALNVVKSYYKLLQKNKQQFIGEDIEFS